MMHSDFQLSWHVDTESYPEWGSAPRKPLVQFDLAHRGEWMGSVIGPHPVTGMNMVYQVIRCEYCIAIHVWPLPSDADLAIFYARHFYEHDKPDMIARYEADAAWWSKCMHGPVLDAAAAAMTLTHAGATRIVDVGAGPGLLLRNATARRWHTLAVEPSPLCAKRLCDAGHVVVPSLAVLRSQTNCFDMVTMWETLEHVPCPEDMLLRVWDLLRPGGVVALCVPNEWNGLQQLAVAELGLPPWWLAPPQHLFYWTKKTLQLQVRRAGFDIVDMRGTFPIEQALFEGHLYVGHDDVGREVHQRRMAYELEMVAARRWDELEEIYRWQLHEQNIGREIICLARKP